MASVVFCLANDDLHAQALVDQLRVAGFPDRDLSVLMHARAARNPQGAKPRNGVDRSRPSSVTDRVEWLDHLGALSIHGTGPLVASGPILQQLGGLASAAGSEDSLMAGLVGFGVPQFEARLYDGKLKTGQVLVAAHTHSREDHAKARGVVLGAGALHVSVGGPRPPPHLLAAAPPT
jgi:hypothetical protein